MKQRNDPANYIINAENGIVLGMKGLPIRKVDGSGYVVIRRGRYADMLVHRVIWESVNGPIPDGMTIDHINGIKSDNRIVNLALVTRGENSKRAHATGLIDNRGQNNGRAILSERCVIEIRQSSDKVKSRELAIKYGVSSAVVRAVIARRTWDQAGVA